MRCKCGFNSFDHNLVCPKCHTDLTATRRLLNLEVPAPGGINFFQVAGQRMATPLPFLGAAAEGEDIQPLEDIQPVVFDDSLEETLPEPQTFEAGLEEITPAHTASAPPQAFAAPADEPMIEIELTDDFEVEQPESPARPESAPFDPLPARQAAMDQIKSALAETGDLNSGDEGEPLETVTYEIPEANREEAASGEDGDLASLVSDLNIEELEGDL